MRRFCRMAVWMLGMLLLTGCGMSADSRGSSVTVQADVIVETEAGLSVALTNALLYAQETLRVELTGAAWYCDISRVFDEIQQEDALARCGLRRCSWQWVYVGEKEQLWFTMAYTSGVSALAQKRQTEQSAMQMAQSIFTLEQSAGEKVLLAHDLLCMHCTYDAASPAAHSAYGAICAGAAVCEGYAEAFALLMTMGGVPCKIICGEARRGQECVPHAWNLVQLAGDWYHVDVTWDDAQNSHNYCLCDDATFAQTHIWDTDAYPVAVGSYSHDVLQELLRVHGAQMQHFSIAYEARLSDAAAQNFSKTVKKPQKGLAIFRKNEYNRNVRFRKERGYMQYAKYAVFGTAPACGAEIRRAFSSTGRGRSSWESRTFGRDDEGI